MTSGKVITSGVSSGVASVMGACLVGSFGAIMMIYGEVKPLLVNMNDTLNETRAEAQLLRVEYQTTNSKIEMMTESLNHQKEADVIINAKIRHISEQIDRIRSGS